MKIVFYSEATVTIGGGLMMTATLASYIADHYENCETYFVSLYNPKLVEIFKGTKAHFLDVNSCDFSQFDGAVFCAPTNYLFYLLARIHHVKKARIILHFYHPLTVDWFFRQLPYTERKDARSILTLIDENNAYCMMDKSDIIAVSKKYDVEFGPHYLPNISNVDFPNEVSFPDTIRNGRVNIGWLGRLDRDKIQSIINLAENLLKSSWENVDIHLIGDGNAKNYISIKRYSPKIRFIITSYLYEEERDKYIRGNIDVMVAMGISSIVAAMQGVPIVIPCVSERRFYNNKFVYLFDALEYGQGWAPDMLEDLQYTTHTIEDILSSIYIKGEKANLGKRCFEYGKENYNIAQSAELFMELAKRSSLTVEKCLENRCIAAEMKMYFAYRKLRKHPNFSAFHAFISKFNQIEGKHGLGKIKYIFRVLLKTIRRRKR